MMRQRCGRCQSAVSRIASTSPTLTMLPRSERISTMRPLKGHSRGKAALSVTSSHSSWSLCTVSPAATFHDTSSMRSASPMSGTIRGTLRRFSSLMRRQLSGHGSGVQVFPCRKITERSRRPPGGKDRRLVAVRLAVVEPASRSGRMPIGQAHLTIPEHAKITGGGKYTPYLPEGLPQHLHIGMRVI